ncbi:MAG: DUF898 family protein [Pseudomonadota bacterium]
MTDHVIRGFGSGPPQPRPQWDLDRYRPEGGTHIESNPDRERPINPEYTAEGWVLFWMALRMGFWTIVTLGIFRFWMTTKLRRHYWGGITLRGDPLEYTGTAMEKLLGFLIAMVFLAVYLGLANLGLTFLGLSIASDDATQANLALNISLLSTLPLIFFAQYRAMRYMLSRTRWRGIRFGLAPGAISYMFRAMFYSFLTLITAGLAYPYQHFKLAKFMTDRAWFGDRQFHQEGTWLSLFASWIWIYILGGFIALSLYTFSEMTPQNFDTMSVLIGAAIYFISVIMLYLTIIRYRFHAFKMLWSGKRLGEDVEFESEMPVGKTVSVFLTGSIVTSLSVSLTILVSVAFLSGLFWLIGEQDAVRAFVSVLTGTENALDLLAESIGDSSRWLIVGGVLLTYLLVIIMVFAIGQVFFVHRILRRKVDTLIVHNPKALSHSGQRAHDKSSEAGGFADALGFDVGAGF